LAGNKPDEARFTKRAQQIREAINRHLWDNSKGLYRDGIPFLSTRNPSFWRPADKEIETFTPHLNALCVLYDIAPAQHHSTIMNYVVNQDAIEIQPYFMYFVLAATHHAGLVNQWGQPLLEKWQKGYDKETFTLRENWSDTTEFGYKGDYSHAWGGAPLSFLSSVVLGISPSKSPEADFQFQPLPVAWLQWARGTLQSPKGTLSTNWKRTDNKVIIEISSANATKIRLNTDYLNASYLWSSNGKPVVNDSIWLVDKEQKLQITGHKKD